MHSAIHRFESRPKDGPTEADYRSALSSFDWAAIYRAGCARQIAQANGVAERVDSNCFAGRPWHVFPDHVPALCAGAGVVRSSVLASRLQLPGAFAEALNRELDSAERLALTGPRDHSCFRIWPDSLMAEPALGSPDPR